jgi:hypothetical protein
MPGRLVFSTTADGASSPTERMSIDSSGRVGIGTTTVQAPLHIGTASAWMDIGASAGNRAKVGYDSNNLIFGSSSSAGQFIFKNNVGSTDHPNSSGSELVRIDASGRLLVGTSTTRTVGFWDTPQVQIEGLNYQESSLSIYNNQDFTYGAVLALGHSRGTSNGSNTVVQNNDYLGTIVFYGSDGSNEVRGAEIAAYVDGTPGANDMPGRLVFSTTADGASSPTERMRIISNGAFTNCLGIYNDTTGAAANMVVNSSGSLQRSTSSAKYKTDIEPLEDQYSDALLNCRPVWYRSTCVADNPDWGWWGFIAEEVAEIDPRLVHWKTTEPVVQENGSLEHVPCDPEPEGVAYDRFVPHLLNLIKRQGEAIADLQAEVAALKAQ